METNLQIKFQKKFRGDTHLKYRPLGAWKKESRKRGGRKAEKETDMEGMKREGKMW